MKLKEMLNESITIKDNEVYLKYEMDRNKYLEIKKFLELIGGSYSSSGKKFIFKNNPSEKINDFTKTGKMPVKNPTAFFPTPKNLIEDMFRISDFDWIYDDEDYQKELKILEPSGGHGSIAEMIRNKLPFARLDVVELLPENFNVLEEKGFEPIFSDFIEFNKDFEIKYDWIFMNPPYQRNTYIKHIKHAFSMLKDNGVLCAVIPTSFIKNKDKDSEWLYNILTLYGDIHINDEGSFKEEGTMVDTCIIHLVKNSIDWKIKEYQGCKNFYVWQVWLSLHCDGEFYNSISSIKRDDKLHNNLRALILNFLDKYKKTHTYFNYSYMDDYVDKILTEYNYIQDELKNESAEEDVVFEFDEPDRETEMFYKLGEIVSRIVNDKSIIGRDNKWYDNNNKEHISKTYFGAEHCTDVCDDYKNGLFDGLTVSAAYKVDESNCLENIIGLRIYRTKYGKAPFEPVFNSEIIVELPRVYELVDNFKDTKQLGIEFKKIYESNFKNSSIQTGYSHEQLQVFASGNLF